jgi:serine phosphatase RsbU (regulator of sigma subunit)
MGKICNFIGISFILSLLCFGSYAQTEVDNLKKSIKIANVEEKINSYNRLSELYRNIDADSSIYFAETAIKLSEKEGTDLQTATGYLNVGVTHRNKGNSKRALEYFLNALLLADKIDNKHLQADILHKVGVTHLFVKEFKEAISFAKREEAIWKELGDEKGLSASLNLSGLAYDNIGEYDIAERKFNAALEIGERKDDPELIYKPLVNLGDLYYRQKKTQKAIEFIERSRKISEKTGNKVGIAAAANNISKTYMLTKEYDKAIAAQQEAIKVATEIQSLPLLRNSYGLCSDIYELSGRHEEALKFHRLYKQIEDSLADKNSRQNITALEAKYSNEKQRQSILLLHEQEKIQKIRIYALLIIAVLFLLALALLINRYQLKQRYNEQLILANQQLTKQAQQISLQRDLIENINNDMLDSVNAAQRIQMALLPTVAVPELTIFQEYFVLDLPRNIVSGDFCWFEKTEILGKEKIFIALGDCTGHGIPAAFLTVLSNSLLTDLIREKPEKSPSQILGELNKRFTALFKQQEYSAEGVDIALSVYDSKTQILTYAGAKIPIYHYRQNVLQVLKGDRVSIGDNISWTPDFVYTNQELQLQKGDILYFCSDGYQDQFGGVNNKKFMASRLRAFLTAIHQQPMREQRQMLLKEKNMWQGLAEQTDDILLLGIKI